MSTAQKIKNIDSDSIIGLPSEICGFKDGVYYSPKSFRNFGPFISNCYNGLFYLLGDFRNSKDFKIFKSRHNPIDKLENPLIIQIYASVLEILDELRKSPRIVFDKRDDYSVMYKGKINFNKTIMKNYGLVHKTFKTINELHCRSLERKFLYFAIKKLPSLIDKYISVGSKNEFYKIFSECNYHIQGIDSRNQELIELSWLVIRKPIEAGENSKMLSHCKVVANFILENTHHSISKKTNQEATFRNKIQYNDFLLNLNRPFEKLLREIILRLPESEISQVKFSKIRSHVTLQKEKEKEDNLNNMCLSGKGTSANGELKHSLIPDVFKVINIGNEKNETDPCLLIFDAKHKEFASIETEMFEADAFIQYNRISRNDLHQLITYIRTNLINNISGIFGFFGYIDESLNEHSTPDYTESFVDCSKDIFGNPNPLVINLSGHGKDQFIYINILGLRFASVLSFVSEACEQNANHPRLLDDLYSRLAIELTHCLFKDVVVEKNETAVKTLNKCLGGACRNLFYAYDKRANFLLEIGEHLIKKFLKLDLKFEVKNSNVNLVIEGKSAPYVEIGAGNKISFFVIDSSEDPMQIFDLHIGTGLFDRRNLDYVAIISRNGIVVYKDGVVGKNPSVLLEISKSVVI